MGKPGKERQEIFGKIETEEQRILSAERKRKEKKAEGRDKKQQEKVSRTFRKRQDEKKKTKGRSKCEFMYRPYPNQLEWHSVECTHMVRG